MDQHQTISCTISFAVHNTLCVTIHSKAPMPWMPCYAFRIQFNFHWQRVCRRYACKFHYSFSDFLCRTTTQHCAFFPIGLYYFITVYKKTLWQMTSTQVVFIILPFLCLYLYICFETILPTTTDICDGPLSVGTVRKTFSDISLH